MYNQHNFSRATSLPGTHDSPESPRKTPEAPTVMTLQLVKKRNRSLLNELFDAPGQDMHCASAGMVEW